MASINGNENSEGLLDVNLGNQDNTTPVSTEPERSCGWCGYIHDINEKFQKQNNETLDVPFDNGEWLPVVPEPEEEIYWWYFPWETNYRKTDCEVPHDVYPFAVWKLVAGKTVTHLPEQCLDFMTPSLACKLLHEPKKVPHVVHFNSEYESVLEMFTSRMLGLTEDVPMTKIGLLNKLFDYTGYIHKNDQKM